MGDGSGQLASVRYQPDEKPPPAVAFGLGVQFALLIIARIVVIPMVVVRAGGGTEAYLSWALFAAVSICGLTTAVQALRLGRIGGRLCGCDGHLAGGRGGQHHGAGRGWPGLARHPGGRGLAGPAGAVRPASRCFGGS